MIGKFEPCPDVIRSLILYNPAVAGAPPIISFFSKLQSAIMNTCFLILIFKCFSIFTYNLLIQYKLVQNLFFY